MIKKFILFIFFTLFLSIAFASSALELEYEVIYPYSDDYYENATALLINIKDNNNFVNADILNLKFFNDENSLVKVAGLYDFERQNTGQYKLVLETVNFLKFDRIEGNIKAKNKSKYFAVDLNKELSLTAVLKEPEESFWDKLINPSEEETIFTINTKNGKFNISKMLLILFAGTVAVVIVCKL